LIYEYGKGNRWLGETVQQRFDRFTIPEPNSGCFLWLGAVKSGGYGQININGRIELATHVALELAGRPLPNGQDACHHCDNPYCVNVDHLFPGTAKQNADDSTNKGRYAGQKPLSVRRAAKSLFEKGFTLSEIVKEIGDIHPSTVLEWMKKWGHKTGPMRREWTHCPKGHLLSGENLYVRPNGRRNCRICRSERAATLYVLKKKRVMGPPA
jgi:hypothetical protein